MIPVTLYHQGTLHLHTGPLPVERGSSRSSPRRFTFELQAISPLNSLFFPFLSPLLLQSFSFSTSFVFAAGGNCELYLAIHSYT